jgi:hypothetical protein
VIFRNKNIHFLLFFLPQIKKNSFTAFLNASLIFTFLIEIGKLFQSLIALYEKLLVLHKFAFGVIKFKLNKGNKKITELRTILQRESQNS